MVPGTRAAGLAMAYKLIDAARARRRAVNAPHLLALARGGAVFDKGNPLERPTDITPPTPPSYRPHTAMGQPERRSPETPRPTGLDNSSAFKQRSRRTRRDESEPLCTTALMSLPSRAPADWYVLGGKLAQDGGRCPTVGRAGRKVDRSDGFLDGGVVGMPVNRGR